VELQIETVHQAQGLELVFGDLTGEPALDLVPKLCGPVGQDFTIEAVVLIHAPSPTYA